MDINNESKDSKSSKKSTQSCDQEPKPSVDNYEELPLINQLFGDDSDDEKQPIKPTVEIKSFFDKIRNKRGKPSVFEDIKTTTEAVLPVDEPVPGCSQWSDEYARQKQFERETNNIIQADENIRAYIPIDEALLRTSIWSQTSARRKLAYNSGPNSIVIGNQTELNIPSVGLKRCDTNSNLTAKDVWDLMDRSARTEPTSRSIWSGFNFKIKAKKTSDLMNVKGDSAKNEPTSGNWYSKFGIFDKKKKKKSRTLLNVNNESKKVFSPVYEPIPGCSKWSDPYLHQIQLERETEIIDDEIDEISMHYKLIKEDNYCTPPEITYENERDNNFEMDVVMQDADSTTYENVAVANSSARSVIVDQQMSDVFSVNKSTNTTGGDLNRYFCDLCDFKCRYFFELDEHEISHTSKRQYVSKTNPYKSQRISDIKSYGKIYDNNIIYACKHCDFICTHKYELNNHEATHSLIRPNVCKHCSYTSNNLNDFKIHESKHSTWKKFKCSKCQYKSKSFNDMKEHEKTHNIKTFICSRCPYTTVKLTDLINHTNTHMTKLPYVCHMCQKSYGSSKDLRHHKRANH